MTSNLMDKDIIERDPTLPGLCLLLDSEAMWAHVRHLPVFTGMVSFKIIYLRYKPATSCVATLLFKNTDGSTGYYFVKALTSERFSDVLARPKQQAKIASGDIIALPQQAIFFTNPLFDRHIPILKLLRDKKHYGQLFRTWLPHVAPTVDVEWRMLRYKPERRAVMQISNGGKPLAVLRMTSVKEFGRILLGSSLGMAIGEINILAADAKQQLLITNWVEGESLDPELGYLLTENVANEIGTALANIHNVKLSLPLTRVVADEIQAMNNVLNTLITIYPQRVAEFNVLALQIAQGLIAKKPSLTLIHGDFSADQVIKSSSDGRLTIIDWERATYGNPMADLATFRARLEIQSIENLITPTQVNQIMSACIDGYTRLRDIAPRALTLYSAWAMLCLAVEPFRKRHKNWHQHIDQLLIKTKNLLAELQRHSPTDALLMAAADPTQITMPMINLLGLSSSYQLTQSNIIRHKIGRRALIDYQLVDSESRPSVDLLGKYNVKGVDHRSFNNQRTLWESGFNNSSPISVPEPLGVLPTFNLWLQRKVTAQPLTALLQPNNPILAEFGHKTAQALVKLQTNLALQQTISPRRWHMSDELNVLRTRLTQAAVLLPHLAIRINNVLQASECLSMSLAPASTTAIHRDFYSDQVMVGPPQSQSRIYLIDLDLCCLGDPALDAGNYLAHIQELALRHYGSLAALLPHEQAFKRQFLLSSPDVTEASLDGFTIISLVRHIFLSTQFDDRKHTTDSLLARCEYELRHWFN